MKTAIQVILLVLPSFGDLGVNLQSSNLDNEIITKGNKFCRTLDEAESTYVDKTLLLKDILDPKFTDHIVLITMPQRFGKSLNLRMIQTFCEIQVFNNGTPVSENPKYVATPPNYHIFVKEYTFGHLKICQEDAFIRENLGKYPVVYLDFLTCLKAVDNLQSGVSCCGIAIHMAFKSHEYLLNSKRLSVSQKVIIQHWISEDTIEYREKMSSVVLGIYNLMDVLSTHFRKKVIVLVDAYANSVITKQLSKDEFESIFNFYTRIFLNSLKETHNLQVAVFTGVVHISECGISSALPRVEKFLFARNDRFVQHYGFSLEEITELFKRPENHFTDVLFDKIKEYYDGYNILGKSIYSPYSINRCLQSKTVKPFWAQVGTISYIWPALRLFQLRFMVLDLCNGKSLIMKITAENNLANLILLQNCITVNRTEYGGTEKIDIFFNFLLDTGYLRINSRNATHFNVTSANEETRLNLHRLTQMYKSKALNDEDACLSVDIGRLLREVDYDHFETKIQEITDKFDQLGKLILPMVPNYKEAELKKIITTIFFHSDLYYYPEAKVFKVNNPNALQQIVTPAVPKYTKKPKTTDDPNIGIGNPRVVDFLLPNITGNFFIFEAKYGDDETSVTTFNQIITQYVSALLLSQYNNQTLPYNLIMFGIHLAKERPYITITARIIAIKYAGDFNNSKTISCQPMQTATYADGLTTEIGTR